MSAAHTPGPWLIATSNSWRRIVAQSGREVCTPTVQRDNHPDLSFPNGGAEGADARLIAAAPELLEALQCLFADYKALADSGDAGFWKIEDTPEGKQALSAIAKATGGAA